MNELKSGSELSNVILGGGGLFNFIIIFIIIFFFNVHIQSKLL